MEKKLVLLTAVFAISAGLVFAQEMKGDAMKQDEGMMMKNEEMMNDEAGAMANEETTNSETAPAAEAPAKY